MWMHDVATVKNVTEVVKRNRSEPHKRETHNGKKDDASFFRRGHDGIPHVDREWFTDEFAKVYVGNTNIQSRVF
jgi:hypothetical protein